MKNLTKTYLCSLVLLFGCDESLKNEDTIGCTTAIPSALEISVVDKETKETIICGTTIIIEDTNYLLEIALPNDQSCENNFSIPAVGNRAGIYNVHVSKEGYLDWSTYNIEVTEGICGVRTVSVKASLEK